jgi:PST family polysaccharide transporter
MKHITPQDRKVLIKNFTYLSVLKTVATFLPLITLPYILRIIEFEKYGIIIMATALVAYFHSLTDFSFKITGTRDIAIFKHSQLKINLIVSRIIVVKTVFLIVSLLVLTTIIYMYEPFYENRLIYFLSVLSLLGYAFSLEWFFLGMEKMEYVSVIQISVKVIFTILVFVFINVKSDFWIYPLLLSSGVVVSAIIGIIVLITKFKFRFIKPKLGSLITLIKTNTPLFFNQFLPNLYNNTSTFLLGIFTSHDIVGIYGALKKVVSFGEGLLNKLSRVYYPFLNRKREAFHNYQKLMLTLSGLLVITFALLSPLIFNLLNIQFNYALAVFLILLIGTIGYAVYDIYGLNYFIIRRQDRLVVNNTLIASVLGLILAFPLIHFFGILGAAVNLSFARWLIGSGLYFKYRNQLL